MVADIVNEETNDVHKSSMAKTKNSLSKKEAQPNDDGNQQRKSPNSKSNSVPKPSSKLSLSTLIMTLGSVIFLITLVVYIPIERLVKKKQIVSDTNKAMFKWMATTDQHIGPDVFFHDVPCYRPGYHKERAVGAEPQRCGTLIYDELVSRKEAIKLRRIASKLINETHSYNRCHKEAVLNIHDFKLIKKVSKKVETVIVETFGIPRDSLNCITVAQFSRYEPLVCDSSFLLDIHQYHIDKVKIARSLVASSILYLSTYENNFNGAGYSFLTAPDAPPFTPYIAQPKIGRLAAWTAGWETPHEVTPLLWGEKLGLLFLFTVHH